MPEAWIHGTPTELLRTIEMASESDWITAVAAAGATITSIVAAIIAARSASAADRSADAAAKTLHRSAVRELVSECHELIEEELRIQSLVIDLKTQLTTLSVFSGSAHNSGIETLKNQFNKDLATAAEATRDAKGLVESPEKLVPASADDLDLWQAKIEAARAKLRPVRESMVRELERISTQNQEARQRRLNGHQA